MLRWIKRAAIAITCILALLLYREWVIFREPLLFLPLGFFEMLATSDTTEQGARDPAAWREPLAPLVTSEAAFEDRAHALSARIVSGANVLVIGATMGGAAAALSAAENDMPVLLTSAQPLLGDEWGADGGMLLDDMSASTPGSPVERALEAMLRLRYGPRDDLVRGLPGDVTDFFRTVLAERSVRLALGYAPVAFTGPSPTNLNRVLLRKTDGSDAMIVPFAILVDGSSTGDLFARTRTGTTSGWDADDLPPAALRALAEGYTLSGRTVTGLGYRLDGGSDVLALLDRGYHGTLIPPRVDDATCWSADTETPSFLQGGKILRARKIGCTVSFDVTASFEDVFDLFLIQHRNDAVDATLTVGEGRLPLHVRRNLDPKTMFVPLGSFPVGPGEPVTVTLRTTLPTNRFEALIAVKRNVGSAPAPGTIDALGHAEVDVEAWSIGTGDVYVATGGDTPPRSVYVDDASYPVTEVGPGTWKASGVTLQRGNRRVTVDGGTNILGVVVSPLAPVEETALRLTSTGSLRFTNVLFPPLPQADAISWAVRVPRDGDYMLLGDPALCGGLCGISLTESGSLTLQTKSTLSGMDRSATKTAVLDVVSLVADRTYILSFANDASKKTAGDIRLVSLDSANADLRSGGQRAATLTPAHGGLYDVWVRASQATSLSIASDGEDTPRMPVEDGMTFLGTRYLSSANGFRVTGGSTLTAIAIPNTSFDLFRRHLPPSTSPATVPLNLPASRLHARWVGDTAPVFAELKNDRGVVQQLTAFSTVFHDGIGGLALTVSPHVTPLDLVLHETLPAPPLAPSGSAEGRLLRLLPAPLAAPVLPAGSPAIAAGGSGLLLLHVTPDGIGPVTLGALGDERLVARLQETAENAYGLLRTVGTPETCTGDTPVCDARRFIRAPFVYGTSEAHAPLPLLPDGRRLAGRDTLNSSGAFLRVLTCRSACARVCSSVPDADGRCIALDQNRTIPGDAVLTVAGVSRSTSITSPREQTLDTLASLLRLLRSDGLLEPKSTYLESPGPARPVSLTLGMFLAQSGPAVLPAHATVSATHAASRALRSARTELAIGDVAGRIAAFALAEQTTPHAVAADPTLLSLLRTHLAEADVTLFPLEGLPDDLVLRRAVQRRILEGRMTADTAVQTLRLPPADPRVTMGDLLRSLVPAAAGSPATLLRTGLAIGLITQDMLRLGTNEIFNLPADPILTLKTEELLQHPPSR